MFNFYARAFGPLLTESTLSVKQLSAGDNIESHCTKCRTLMNHTIVALINDQPGRVECNTCKGVHNYRKPTVKKVASGSEAPSSARKKSTRKVDPDLTTWAELSLDQKKGVAVTYSLQGVFKQEQIVNHPTFGLGMVMQLLPPNKVEVLFQDGRKLLRCG